MNNEQNALEYNLEIFQGDTFEKIYQVMLEDDLGNKIPMDLTDSTFQGFIKANYNSETAAEFDISLKQDAGEDYPSSIRIFLSDTVTETLCNTDYVYDIEMNYDNKKSKLLAGKLIVKPEVTK